METNILIITAILGAVGGWFFGRNSVRNVDVDIFYGAVTGVIIGILICSIVTAIKIFS